MKRKVVTKLFALGLIATMAASLTIGCAKKEDSGSSKDSGSKSEEQVLNVAAFEGGYGKDLWTDVAKAFEETHEGVKVKLQVDKKIEDKITPAMKSGDYPDVIHIATGRDAGLTETITKEKGLTELDSVLDMKVPGEDVTVKEKVLPGFLDTLGTQPYNDGKTYYAPMFYAPCGLFYNEALLTENGWEVPKTWDEMWALGDKAKEKGIALFTYPHAGYFDAFIYAMLESSGGVDFYNKCMTYEGGIWESPEATKVFETIGKLASYVEPTTLGNANEESFTKNQQLVLDNKAIFIPNGTWLPGEMKDAPTAEGFKWGFTALPAVSTDQKPSSFTFFEQMWIPKEGKNQELAKEWIAFMYSDKAADIFAESNAIQPIVGISEKLTGDNQMFYSIYDNDAAVPVMGGFASTNPVEGVSMNDTLFRAVDSIVSGDKTVPDWQKSVEEASVKLKAAME